jgi:16S rRNA processing protein RimM
VTEYYLIAKIASVDGDKGFVKLDSFSDVHDRFNKLKKVYIDFWGEKKILTVESVKEKKNKIYLKFLGFDNKISSEILIGKEIFVDTQNLHKLPKHHYYIHDLIGCEVVRNGKKFGEVTDVYNFKANDVYVIEKMNGEEILIPAIHEFIESIDISCKVLTLKPGEGFYEDEN